MGWGGASKVFGWQNIPFPMICFFGKKNRRKKERYCLLSMGDAFHSQLPICDTFWNALMQLRTHTATHLHQHRCFCYDWRWAHPRTKLFDPLLFRMGSVSVTQRIKKTVFPLWRKLTNVFRKNFLFFPVPSCFARGRLFQVPRTRISCGLIVSCVCFFGICGLVALVAGHMTDSS